MPAGPRIRANFAYGTTTDNPLTAGATSFNSAELPTLPVVSSAHAVVTLDPRRVFGEPEIVVVTTHTAAATVATITRGQYGTVARSHPQGTEWVHSPIDEDFIEVLTSVTRPSNPYGGQLIFETDTNIYTARNAANSAWVEGLPIGAWKTWTPSFTQGVALTINNAYSVWTKLGRLVIAIVNVITTSAGTSGQPIQMNIPTIRAAGDPLMGTMRYFDAGNTIFVGTPIAASDTIVQFNRDQFGSFFGGEPIAVANGDAMQIQIIYQSAS